MGGGGDEDVEHVAIVSYFDETDTIDPKKSLREGGDSSGENATSEVEEKQLVKLLEEAAEAEEKEALADTVDLFWLQEQIDLLSHFESSLSLDSVHRHSSGRKGCNKKMKQMAAMGQVPNQYQHQQQQSPLRRSGNNEGGGDDGDLHSALGVSLLAEGSYDYNYPTEEGEGEEGSSYIAFFWDQFDWSPEDEAAEDALPLYHPGSLKQQKQKKESNNNGSNHNGSSGRDIGIN